MGDKGDEEDEARAQGRLERCWLVPMRTLISLLFFSDVATPCRLHGRPPPALLPDVEIGRAHV